MDTSESGGSIKTGELAALAAIAVVLLAIALPILSRHRKEATETRHTGVASILRRVESAKSQYVTDHSKQPGDPVAMKDLVSGGYLTAEPVMPDGGRFVVGNVGTPVEYDADAGQERYGRDGKPELR